MRVLISRQKLVERLAGQLSRLRGLDYRMSYRNSSYGDELCPELVITRPGQDYPCLVWFACVPEVGDQGLALGIEWRDDATGIVFRAITEDIEVDFDEIDRITQDALSGGVILTKYRLAGMTFRKALSLRLRPDIRLYGKRLSGSIYWPCRTKTAIFPSPP